jgi:hypothetical protein
LLKSWKEKVSFITKHNYLKKIKKIQFINAQAGGRLFQDCTNRTDYLCPVPCAHNTQLQSKLSGNICNFVIKGEDKQCNNIVSKCKKKSIH